MNSFHTPMGFVPALDRNEWRWLESSDRALVLDTETMGTAQHIEATEITAKTLHGERVINYLILPVETSKQKKVAAADKKRIEGGESVPLRHYWDDVHGQIKQAVSGKIIIAYGAGFDRRVLAAQTNYKFPPDPLDESGWRCMMPITRAFFGSKKNLTLSEACRRMNAILGIPEQSESGEAPAAARWHTAEWDVDQTIKLLHFLMERIS